MIQQVKDGELDLQPGYQRGLVWSQRMASHLVMTALDKRWGALDTANISHLLHRRDRLFQHKICIPLAARHTAFGIVCAPLVLSGVPAQQ